MGAGTEHQLRISLREVEPEIWRRVVVSSDVDLRTLHTVLQAVMGWMDSHLHEFVVGGDSYGEPDDDSPPTLRDEARTTLAEIAPAAKSSFVYEYDFGDGWEHTVLVEQIQPASDGGVRVRCTGGEHSCPPEDCGGPYGYIELLEDLSDPENADDPDRLEWLGLDFDPEAFDIEEVNARLANTL